MLFNTLNFLFFFLSVFILYWFVFNKSIKVQNLFLLTISYIFYATWDWRFLFLLIFSTWLDFVTGFKIAEAKSRTEKKRWLFLSVLINLGFLGFFKYFNFFIASFSELLESGGLQTNSTTLKIILPVGISFYTFHGLSYVLDIYNGKIKPEKNYVDYSLFVSFFPLLVAGPIERATHLLPQIKQQRFFDYGKAVDGLKQILWGVFKKVVIADNCAYFADRIFDGHADYNSATLFMGAIFFAFQIYGDFSGYSDIALGTSRLLGIELLKNFSYPYFSRNIAEFWRRWHISLTTWFRDYLYIPLGGSRLGKWGQIRNTFIIFTISGFWHGANWTFIVWGLLNALYFLPLLLLNQNRNYLDIVAAGKNFPSLKDVFKIIATFLLTVIAWVFFRSNSVVDAINYLQGIFEFNGFRIELFNILHFRIVTGLILFFIAIEWAGRESSFAIQNLTTLNKTTFFRLSFYFLLSVSVLLFGGSTKTFIYFQF